MAVSKILLVSLFVSLLVLQFVEASEMVDSDPDKVYTADKKMNCGSACAARCKLASRTKMCLRACGTCCARCNCVPPGTSGNEDICPCYAKMTTHGGRHKCP